MFGEQPFLFCCWITVQFVLFILIATILFWLMCVDVLVHWLTLIFCAVEFWNAKAAINILFYKCWSDNSGTLFEKWSWCADISEEEIVFLDRDTLRGNITVPLSALYNLSKKVRGTTLWNIQNCQNILLADSDKSVIHFEIKIKKNCSWIVYKNVETLQRMSLFCYRWVYKNFHSFELVVLFKLICCTWTFIFDASFKRNSNSFSRNLFFTTMNVI